MEIAKVFKGRARKYNQYAETCLNYSEDLKCEVD